MTALGIDTEVMIMFLTTLFFTVCLLVSREKGFQLFFSGTSTVCWIVTGVIFVASGATFSPLGLLFVAIGLCFIGFDYHIMFSKPNESDMEET